MNAEIKQKILQNLKIDASKLDSHTLKCIFDAAQRSNFLKTQNHERFAQHLRTSGVKMSKLKKILGIKTRAQPINPSEIKNMNSNQHQSRKRIARNKPCPLCESGKKYKKCCGAR